MSILNQVFSSFMVLSSPSVSVGDPVVDVTLTTDDCEQHNDGFPATASGMTASKNLGICFVP
jgi:hypothetical protein